VSKRVPSFALVLVLIVLGACGSGGLKGRPVKTAFLPQTVDFLSDVGRGNSIALDSDGNPHMAYIGLVEKPKKGVIPPARPATAPALPAVLTASQSDGVFSHGDVVQTDITTAKPVPLPLTADSATGITVTAKGAVDVVWTQFGSKDAGVFYATAPNTLAPFGDPIKVTSTTATSPAVAADQDGNPIVVFVDSNASGSPTVESATLGQNGKSFQIQQVAVLDPCDAAECTAANAGVVATPAGFVVAYSDPATGSVDVAQSTGGSWTSTPIEQNVGAYGVGIAPGAKGAILVSYLTQGDARVASATDPAGSWTVLKAPAFAKPARQGTGAGTAVGEAQNTIYVAYTDPDDGTIALASSRGGAAFSRIDTPGTEKGLYPSLVVSDAGLVQLAWYDSVALDMMLGLYPQELQVLAAPPSPSVYTPPQASGSAGACPKNTVEIIAPVGAGGSGFQTTDVTAPSGDFTVCFNNQDNTNSHNVAIFKDEATATSGGAALAKDDPFTGPKIDTFDAKGLAPGDYYFHCDVHPTTMTGTLTVK